MCRGNPQEIQAKSIQIDHNEMVQVEKHEKEKMALIPDNRIKDNCTFFLKSH